METQVALRKIAVAGIAVSVALAGVAYLVSTGSGGGQGLAWCLFIFALLEYASWQYLFYCMSYQCPGPGKDGQDECIERCLVKFLIIQLLVIIFLLSCLLLTTGPRW